MQTGTAPRLVGDQNPGARAYVARKYVQQSFSVRTSAGSSRSQAATSWLNTLSIEPVRIISRFGQIGIVPEPTWLLKCLMYDFHKPEHVP